MRSKTVTVNGKQIVVREHKIKELREEVIPKILGALENEDFKDKEVKDLIPLLEQKLSEFFPGLSEADIEEAYPSEIEELITSWVDVNFFGVKKLMKPLLSLTRLGSSLPKLGS
ncbi:hypothetical protein [Paenibacillus sp. Pae108]|uniref:hypothetical protein n=1 Tax=Paenibacillus sp. Pae108 TaxID=2926019 RepID=UPI002117A109|nr:hypothetical protein [Paenibacillus sp. Pae108]